MKISDYIKETRSEMSHVTWPTRVQAINYALLVIGVSVVIAAFLGICDFVFSRILNLFF
jgi:preprotein translocase SecE subunit